MTGRKKSAGLDQDCDPFGHHSRVLARKPLHLLGARFHFESNHEPLLQLIDHAYAGLPRHKLSGSAPDMRVRLLLTSGDVPRKRSEPPQFRMLSGAGFLGGATDSSNFVVLSPQEKTAIVGVSPEMLRYPYHTRYELIEFAVFTLAVWGQKLTSLHGACVGRNGRGVLLMGPSGTGKSTVALLSLLEGLDFLSEDSVFVAPDTMLATGIPNFLHVRGDSLRWVGAADARKLRNSPTIRRRSGVRKLEVDLRQGDYRLAQASLKVCAIVFLSADSAGAAPLLKPLAKSDLLERLRTEQAYAANHPQWGVFKRNVSRLDAFELRRGRHPLESVEALRLIVG
jgi:hypothetical protein